MKPLEKMSRTEKVLVSLKEYITSGQFSVGDKFSTENEIGGMLNVGRSTVREAYRILQALGYLEVKPGRGAFVAKINEEDKETVVEWFTEHGVEIMDFIDVRMAIEPLAVKLLIERADGKDIDKLEMIHEEFKHTINSGDSIKLSFLDQSFHNTIVEATNNKLLISINQKISDAFIEYRNKAFSVRENVIHALKPHEDILNSIKSRDAQTAQKSMIKHLEISLEDIRGVIDNKE